MIRRIFRNVCSTDLNDNPGKEEFYLHKITIYDVSDYHYSSNCAIISIQIYLIIKAKYIYANIYVYEKSKNNINIQDA